MLPEFKAYQGDTFTVKIFAFTGTKDLSTWTVTLDFDSTYMSLSSFSTSNLWNAPVIGTSSGEIVISVVGYPSSTTPASVTGYVLLGSVTFSVSSGTSGVSIPVTAVGSRWVSAAGGPVGLTTIVGQFSDLRDGWYTTGIVSVGTPGVAGVYISSGTSTLFNSAILNGVNVRSSFSTVVAYNFSRSSFPDFFTMPISCSTLVSTSSFASSVSGSACAITVSSSSSDGVSSSTVVANTLYGSVSFAVRVYFPYGAEVYSTRNTLRAIGCNYESASLRVLMNLTLGLTTPVISGVDVTRYLTFISSSPSTIKVDGSVITGLGFGTALITSPVTSTPFAVSGVANMISLKVYTYINSATVNGLSLTEGAFGTVSVKIDAVNLNTEGSYTYLVAYAKGNDGAFTDVTSQVTLSSTQSSDITVSKSGTNWIATVPSNAASISGPYINAVYKDTCGATLGTGVGYIETSLPSPKSATITASNVYVVPANSGASALGKPTSSSFTVNLLYQDIPSKDMTLDTRTVYTVTASPGVRG
jgi:hypothetical protein